MKPSLATRCFALSVLLLPVSGIAAVVTAIPSTPAPGVGDSFFITVSGTGFPTTTSATLGLTFDSAVVSMTGVELAADSPFAGGVVAPSPFHSGDSVSILGPLSGPQPSGDFAAFRVTFRVLAAGNPAIALVDDGGEWGWLGEDDKPIRVTYNQAALLTVPAPTGGQVAAPSPTIPGTPQVAPGEAPPPPAAQDETQGLPSFAILLLGAALVAVAFYVWRLRK
jgi:hypothetical protein